MWGFYNGPDPSGKPPLIDKLLSCSTVDRACVARPRRAGTPQGSILSPLLSNVALSVLDEYIAHAPGGPGNAPPRRDRRPGRGASRGVGQERRCDRTCSSNWRARSYSPSSRRSAARLLAERRVAGWSSPSTRR